MEDIEDLVNETSELRDATQGIQNVVLRQTACSPTEPVDDPSSSVIPGVQTVWLHTFGCSHNVSDGEYMKGKHPQSSKYKLAPPMRILRGSIAATFAQIPLLLESTYICIYSLFIGYDNKYIPLHIY